MNYFIFDGESSLDYGVYIGGQNTFNAPQRDVAKVSIPGRNGDLVQDNGRFLNVQVPYNIVVMDSFRDKTDAIKAWLLSKKGYCKLVDTYHPGTYRMARVAGGIDFETAAYNLTGKTQVIFDCKPERFLDSGDEVFNVGERGQTKSASGSILNPTRFPSKPKMRVKGQGSGTVTVEENTIVVSNLNEYVDIDSELMNCYKGATNKNADVALPNHEYPELHPGANRIEFGGGVTAVEVQGRWWTI